MKTNTIILIFGIYKNGYKFHVAKNVQKDEALGKLKHLVSVYKYKGHKITEAYIGSEKIPVNKKVIAYKQGSQWIINNDGYLTTLYDSIRTKKAVKEWFENNRDFDAFTELIFG